MNHLRRAVLVSLSAAVLFILGTRVWCEEEVDQRLKKLDSGPATIDVSHYPPEMQKAYALFSQRCTKCHTLARPINSDYALPEEWERYVKRMMRKPGSGVSSTDGKTIYQFLVYDSSVRKKDLIEQKKKGTESQSEKK